MRTWSLSIGLEGKYTSDSSSTSRISVHQPNSISESTFVFFFLIVAFNDDFLLFFELVFPWIFEFSHFDIFIFFQPSLSKLSFGIYFLIDILKASFSHGILIAQATQLEEWVILSADQPAKLQNLIFPDFRFLR